MPRRQRATQQRSLVAMAGWCRRRMHSDEARVGMKQRGGLQVPLSSTRWSDISLCHCSRDLLPKAKISSAQMSPDGHVSWHLDLHQSSFWCETPGVSLAFTTPHCSDFTHLFTSRLRILLCFKNKKDSLCSARIFQGNIL